jgi:hypothetical protein
VGRRGDTANSREARKRDGVYYTPEWLARALVAATIGAGLHEARATLDLDAHAELLAGLRVLDPACGEGALLLAAFTRLHEEWRWLAQARGGGFDAAAAATTILQRNLHGVDISADAVATAELALQSRAAELGAELGTELGAQLLVGDALVDPAQTWPRWFPRCFASADPGFDCIVGNPPYVKLQQLRRDRAALADYLVAARTDAGDPVYASTQTGSFDLYLPFIELGVGLLARAGRLGYIAPSSWVINEHGEGLRGVVRAGRSLVRWIDLRGYQAFEGVVTYTALQVFGRRPQAGIRCEVAARGPADLERLDALEGDPSEATGGQLRYADLPERGPWALVPAAEARLLIRLRGRCPTLADSCEQIAVGVQTSADSIYQLERLGPGVYRRLGAGASRDPIALEDAVMRPLLSGAEVDRYRAPQTRNYVLFPYVIDELGKARLRGADEFERDYPHAWAYLRAHERVLRARERGKMDRDDRWWGYNYPKNLAKQGRAKLVVAQTVPALRVAYDERGEFCLDNVRVNGVFTADSDDAWFLLGVLNGPIADRLFRATAKPKAGGYYEANRQFIAPLPIPPADSASKREVGARARALQQLHTRRGAGIVELDRLLAGCGRGRALELGGVELGPGAVVEVCAGPSLRVAGEVVAVAELGPGESAIATLACWRQAVRSRAGRRLVRALRALPGPGVGPGVGGCEAEIGEADAALVELEATIATAEGEIAALLERLYGLGEGELVELSPA